MMGQLKLFIFFSHYKNNFIFSADYSDNAVTYVRMFRDWNDLYFPKGCGRTEGGVPANKPVTTNPTQRPTSPPSQPMTPTKHHHHSSSIRPSKPGGTTGCKNCQVRPKPQPGGTGGLGSPAAPGGVPINQDLKPNYRKLLAAKSFEILLIYKIIATTTESYIYSENFTFGQQQGIISGQGSSSGGSFNNGTHSGSTSSNENSQTVVSTGPGSSSSSSQYGSNSTNSNNWNTGDQNNWQSGGSSSSSWGSGGSSASNWTSSGGSGSNWQQQGGQGSSWQQQGGQGSNWQQQGGQGSNWQQQGGSTQGK